MTGRAIAVGRFARAAVLIAFLLATASGSLVSKLHFVDVRLPMFLVASAIASPALAALLLAARGRGAPWGWLGFALAWGAFAAPWVTGVGEAMVAPLVDGVVRWVAALGAIGPAVVTAPLVEEPAKLVGIWIALSAAWRAGARASVGLGAAVGGLVGLAFGVAEVSHHLGEVTAALGYVDVSGAFVVEWPAVRQFAELQLVERFFLLGLSNHALFAALAGAGLALFVQRRRGLAVTCFVAALAAHALTNSVGFALWDALFSSLRAGLGPFGLGPVPTLVAAWVAALGGFLVAEAWAALLLLRIARSGPGRTAAA